MYTSEQQACEYHIVSVMLDHTSGDCFKTTGEARFKAREDIGFKQSALERSARYLLQIDSGDFLLIHFSAVH